MFGKKHEIGKSLIDGVERVFESMEADLIDGTNMLHESIKEKQEVITKAEDHISICEGQIMRADKLRANLRAIRE